MRQLKKRFTATKTHFRMMITKKQKLIRIDLRTMEKKDVTVFSVTTHTFLTRKAGRAYNLRYVDPNYPNKGMPTHQYVFFTKTQNCDAFLLCHRERLMVAQRKVNELISWA